MEDKPTLFVSEKASKDEVESVLQKWHNRYEVPPYLYVLQQYVDRHFPAMWHQKNPCILTDDLKRVEVFEGAAPPETCSICWNPMQYCVTISCGHSFHRGCLRKWISSKQGAGTCPLCRGRINV